MTDSAGETVVEITGLTKRYADHVAVDDLSLSVRRGEIFGILGTNGAGKTTSVECAQGIRRADRGDVRVLGFDPISQRNRLRGRVGSQLQDSNLPDRMRVREALGLFANTADQANRLMQEWDLDDLAGKPFASLSGGERQRLFLALALINEPELVFLDELTQGLDPSARRGVWKLIEGIRDRGTTVVLVTHFMEEAETLCDRVVVMAHGRALDRGTPDELIARHTDGVRMRFRSDNGDVSWLRDLPGVVAATLDGGYAEVRGPSPIIAHVGAGLVTRGRVPESIRVTQPDLEAAVLRLIAQAVG